MTTMTHQMLLKIVPRTVDSTAHGEQEEAEVDRDHRRLATLELLAGPPAGDTMPTTTPTATMPTAM